MLVREVIAETCSVSRVARVTVLLTYLLTAAIGRHAGGAPLFVGALLAFFACFAAAQTALFCIFNEVYGACPKRGEWLGYISSVASLGRCVGPLWAVALYDVAYEPEQGSGDMRRGGGGDGGDLGSGAFAAPSAAEAAALPIWLINGGGTLLGAALVLAAWKTLKLQPVP